MCRRRPADAFCGLLGRCVLYVLFYAPMLCPDSGQMKNVPDARTSGGTKFPLLRRKQQYLPGNYSYTLSEYLSLFLFHPVLDTLVLDTILYRCERGPSFSYSRILFPDSLKRSSKTSVACHLRHNPCYFHRICRNLPDCHREKPVHIRKYRIRK